MSANETPSKSQFVKVYHCRSKYGLSTWNIGSHRTASYSYKFFFFVFGKNIKRIIFRKQNVIRLINEIKTTQYTAVQIINRMRENKTGLRTKTEGNTLTIYRGKPRNNRTLKSTWSCIHVHVTTSYIFDVKPFYFVLVNITKNYFRNKNKILLQDKVLNLIIDSL